MDISSEAAFAAEAETLSFKYTTDSHAKRALTTAEVSAAPFVLKDVNFTLAAGSRTLLCGVNGAGKSTLLELLAGRRRPVGGEVSVLGADPFVNSREAATVLLGAGWANEISRYASLPVQQLLESAARAPLPRAMLKHIDRASSNDGAAGGSGDPASAAASAAQAAAEVVQRRCVMLAQLLEVDAAWITTELSEGQKRRVQLACGLAAPSRLLLLDEVTAELDILTRRRLLTFLHADSRARGAAVVCCTHVFDGLGCGVMDTVLQLEGGAVRRFGPLLAQRLGEDDGIAVATRQESPEDKAPFKLVPHSLHTTVLGWLSAEEQPSPAGSAAGAGALLSNDADATLFVRLLGVAGGGGLSGGGCGGVAGGNGNASGANGKAATPVLQASGFTWGYKEEEPLFEGASFALTPGDRCLLTGGNGAGKTTLLSILSGARLVLSRGPPSSSSSTQQQAEAAGEQGSFVGVRTLGVDPSSGGFVHAVLNKGVVHVSTGWRARLKEIVGGGAQIPFKELAASALKHAVAELVSSFVQSTSASSALPSCSSYQVAEVLKAASVCNGMSAAPASAAEAAAETSSSDNAVAVAAVERAAAAALGRRLDELRHVLGVDDGWVPFRVSAGQRARVQLCLQLLAPKRVLLMDEVTAELDVCARKRLLDFLKREAAGPLKLCVVYATHVLEGLDGWATKVLHLRRPPKLPVVAASGPRAASISQLAVSIPGGVSGGSAALFSMDQVASVAVAAAAAAVSTSSSGVGANRGGDNGQEAEEGLVYRAVLSWLRKEEGERRAAAAVAFAAAPAPSNPSLGHSLEFPSTAAIAKMRQDASILNRSNKWDGRGDLPKLWAQRTNALPGGMGSHSWGNTGPGGGAGEDSGDAERRLVTVAIPSLGEAESFEGDASWVPPLFPKELLAPLPVRKQAVPEKPMTKCIAPHGGDRGAAATALSGSTPSAASVSSPAAVRPPPRVPASVLLPALGQLEGAVAALKASVEAGDQGGAKAKADALTTLWQVLGPAVDGFAGLEPTSARRAAPSQKGNGHAGGGGGGGGGGGQAPAVSSSAEANAPGATGGNVPIPNPFGSGRRGNAMSEQELIQTGVVLGDR